MCLPLNLSSSSRKGSILNNLENINEKSKAILFSSGFRCEAGAASSGIQASMSPPFGTILRLPTFLKACFGVDVYLI